MPPQDRVRPNDKKQTEHAGPPSHPRQQCPVARTKPWMRCTPQGNIELKLEKEDFDLEPAPRPE
jgi:hypothetical protein